MTAGAGVMSALPARDRRRRLGARRARARRARGRSPSTCAPATSAGARSRDLRVVADVLPLTAPPVDPPPALKEPHHGRRRARRPSCRTTRAGASDATAGAARARRRRLGGSPVARRSPWRRCGAAGARRGRGAAAGHGMRTAAGAASAPSARRSPSPARAARCASRTTATARLRVREHAGAAAGARLPGVAQAAGRRGPAADRRALHRQPRRRGDRRRPGRRQGRRAGPGHATSPRGGSPAPTGRRRSSPPGRPEPRPNGRCYRRDPWRQRTWPPLLPPPRARDRRLLLELRPADLPGLHDADPGRHALPGVRAPAARRCARLRRPRSEPSRASPMAIIVVCVVAFLAERRHRRPSGGGNGDDLPTTARSSARRSASDGEYWRLVTSGFLHAGIFHIVFNMYLLWMLGQMLEPAIGSRALRRALLHVAARPARSARCCVEPEALTVGASGAVFGLMGGARGRDARAAGSTRSQTGIGRLIIINLARFVIPNISIGGHVGGLIGGALAAGLARSERRRDRGCQPGLRPTRAVACGRGRLRSLGGDRRSRGSSAGARQQPVHLSSRFYAAGAGSSTSSAAAGRLAARGRGAGRGPAARGRRPAAGPGARSAPRRRPRRPPRAERAQLRRVDLGLLERPRGVVAAGHADDDLGRRRARPPPRCSARSARRAKPSTSTPPASSMSCGVQWPATNTGSSHSSAATRHRLGARGPRGWTASTRARWRATRSSAASRAPVACASVRMSPIVSPSVLGSSAMTFGRWGSSRGDRATSS